MKIGRCSTKLSLFDLLGSCRILIWVAGKSSAPFALYSASTFLPIIYAFCKQAGLLTPTIPLTANKTPALKPITKCRCCSSEMKPRSTAIFITKTHFLIIPKVNSSVAPKRR